MSSSEEEPLVASPTRCAAGAWSLSWPCRGSVPALSPTHTTQDVLPAGLAEGTTTALELLAALLLTQPSVSLALLASLWLGFGAGKMQYNKIVQTPSTVRILAHVHFGPSSPQHWSLRAQFLRGLCGSGNALAFPRSDSHINTVAEHF